MIIVLARWERGWLDPRVELNQWKDMIKAFNVDKFIMIPKTGIMRDTQVDFEEFDKVEDALEKYKNLKRVFVEAPIDFQKHNIKYVPLRKYKHPKDAIYLFGKSGTDNIYLMKEGDDAVAIETPKTEVLWGVIACGIVLYDRVIKWQ